MRGERERGEEGERRATSCLANYANVMQVKPKQLQKIQREKLRAAEGEGARRSREMERGKERQGNS